MMPLPCTVQKVETRELVKVAYDLDLQSGETKNSKAHVFHTLKIMTCFSKYIIYVYNKMLHACVTRKSSYISEENGAILNVFFCCLHHRVVLWTTSWKGFTGFNIRRNFQFIPKNVYMQPWTWVRLSVSITHIHVHDP